MILTTSRTQGHGMGYVPIRAGFQPPFPVGPFDSASGCMVERRGAGFSGIPPLEMGWPCGGLTSRMRLRSVTMHIPWVSRSPHALWRDTQGETAIVLPGNQVAQMMVCWFDSGHAGKSGGGAIGRRSGAAKLRRMTA